MAYLSRQKLAALEKDVLEKKSEILSLKEPVKTKDDSLKLANEKERKLFEELATLKAKNSDLEKKIKEA